MNRRVCCILILFIFSFYLYAKPTIDEAISNAAVDIADKCEANSILVIDDFASPTSKMTIYIREQLADSIFSEDGLLQIVTREHMDKIEKELKFQNSGIVNEKTILSVAERVGAQLLVFGKFEDYNNGYMLRVRILDIKTGSYVFRKTYNIKQSQKTEELLAENKIKKNKQKKVKTNKNNYEPKKVAVGLLTEANNNSLDYIAPGIGFSFNYNFIPIYLSTDFSIGAKILISHDIYETKNQFMILESVGLLRFYLVPFMNKYSSGLFVEVQAGASSLFINSEISTMLNIGACTGYKIPFGSFYIESELRFGYPYFFGCGVSIGMQF